MAFLLGAVPSILSAVGAGVKGFEKGGLKGAVEGVGESAVKSLTGVDISPVVDGLEGFDAKKSLEESGIPRELHKGVSHALRKVPLPLQPHQYPQFSIDASSYVPRRYHNMVRKRINDLRGDYEEPEDQEDQEMNDE